MHPAGPPHFLTAALALVLAAGATGGQSPVAPQATMDQALALLAESRQQFQKVQDYTCTLLKRERVGGQLLPENVMTFQVRNEPFSVRLVWQAPRALLGQEVCYVAGRNRGMMRVHPVGIAGIFGFVSIDPRDPRALRESRHPITDAGLGNLLEGIARQWELERRWNKTVVHITEVDFHGRPCVCIETLHPDRTAGTFYGYRCLLCLDKAARLPVHSAAYDWPRPGGDPGGDLLEAFSYLNLQCNIGLGDAVFDR